MTTSNQMSPAAIKYFSRRDRQKSLHIDPDSENADSTYYLHKIALHDTGTCDSCGEAETIKHHLINCSQNEIAAAVKNICDQRKMGDQLHITDDSTSGSGSRSDPSPDSPTVVRVNHGSEA